jgi:hypothetical protein
MLKACLYPIIEMLINAQTRRLDILFHRRNCRRLNYCLRVGEERDHRIGKTD